MDQIPVIDLWAMRRGHAHLQAIAETYADQGVKIYGLSVDSKVELVRRFCRGFDPPTSSLGFLGRDAMQRTDVSGIPALCVVGPDG